ncbi:unnamed protein product [Rotaria sp. Silwood2]|nr:unnamed protein product [Rotaria sp. Silwood2]CAF2736948.1 unnamed protein product [Rotaria sp. Silwood2]CAF3003751.1 unnamed protein product [Rotaria sp. Silwood2]CAF3129696.1 unnamed protein product [Rotaria sp. Silwood2]CAF3989914.1 unnamed protein product [Rotaria sp. Silwood2]
MVSIYAASLAKKEQTITLRGRVIFPSGSRMPIESDGTLTVELQDTSLADAPARVIAQGTGKAIRFPMAFAIKYSPKQIIPGSFCSLHVTIRNKNNELLYINDVHIRVNPIGLDRTTFIDVPVILVKNTKPVVKKTQWPELVGMNGQDAVQIIKQETGFSNVVTIQEGSPVTLDYRTDRVRVFVDNKGIVKGVPNIA